MPRKPLFALAAGLMVAQAAAIDLKGIEPGQTLAEVDLRYSGFSSLCGKPEAALAGASVCLYVPPSTPQAYRPQIVPLDTFAGQQVKYFAVRHRDNIVRSVSIALLAASFAPATAALEEKLGKPVTREASVIQNRLGAKFDQQVITWLAGDQVLIAKKFAADVNTSSFSLTSKAAAEAEAAATKEAAKSHTKDL